MSFEKFEPGDKVLFNDRKIPLTVEEIDSEQLLVKGPKGGEYEIYLDGNTRLIAKPDNKKYASYCNNLRKVGEWIREGKEWKHTKSKASIKIIRKDNGFWTLKSEKFSKEMDLPLYGFSSKEAAVQYAKKFTDKRPEG